MRTIVRHFGRLLISVGVIVAATAAHSDSPEASTEAPRTFNVWAASCAHIGVDSLYGIEPMRHAFRQSEGYWSFLTPAEQRMARVAPAFNWDIMVNVGDFATGQFPPSDGEGRAVVDQYDALALHKREQIYTVAGNHDAGYYDQGLGSWFQKWSDPLGQNTDYSGVDSSRRPFPIEGTWERYKFEAGNVLFLMLSDRNDAPTPVGRGHSRDRNMGGFPAGAVTRETFNWWKEQVLANQDKIIITAHHHVLRDTTKLSSYGGGDGLHARGPDFAGASFLYYTIENDDPENFLYSTSNPENPDPFETFLADFEAKNGRPAIDVWIGGHTHSEPGVDADGRGLTEERWGVTFVQAAALTHRNTARVPLSRMLGFSHGSTSLEIGLYVHGAPHYSHAPREILKKLGVDLDTPEPPEGALTKNGWFEPESRTAELRHPFKAP